MKKKTAFSVGRRYYVDNAAKGSPSFWFVIIGPAQGYAGATDNYFKNHKRIRIETDTRAVAENPNTVKYLQDRSFHGIEQDRSHLDLKKYGVLEP